MSFSTFLSGGWRPAQLVHRVDVLARHRAVEDRSRPSRRIPGRDSCTHGSRCRSAARPPIISLHAAVDRRHHLGAASQRAGDDCAAMASPPHPEMALGMTYLRTLDARGRDARGAAAARPTPRRYSTASTASACPAAPTSTRPPTARRSATRSSGRPSRASTRSSSRCSRGALERGMPILAICRGAQALNVACGGTLHQHVAGPPPDRAAAASRRTRSRSRRARAWPASCGARTVARQLLPPPGGRPRRPRPARRRPRRRRHGRGVEGPRLRRRRAVARRDARRSTCACSRRSWRPPPAAACAPPP